MSSDPRSQSSRTSTRAALRQEGVEPLALSDSFLASFDEFLDELSNWTQESGGAANFYRHLTCRLRQLVDGENVLIWIAGAQSGCQIAVNANAQSTRSDAVFTREEFDTVAASAGTMALDGNGCWRFAHFIDGVPGEEKVLMLSFLDRPEQRWESVYQDLLVAVSEIASNFERRMVVQDRRQKLGQLESFVRLTLNAHSSLDLGQVAHQLCNDSRALLHADRVWAYSTSGRLQLLACSGVTEVNQRAKTAKLLRRVVASAIAGQESFQLHRTETATDSSRSALGFSFLKQEESESIYVTILRRPGTQQIIGVLVTEFFGEHDRLAILAGLNNISTSAESSINNATAHSRIPFQKFWRAANWCADWFRLSALPRTALVLAVGIVGLWLMFSWTTDFEIEVQGALRPEIERHAFAPTRGLVQHVAVEYGDWVKRGDVLAEMSSPEYELKLNELQGELSAARNRLEANQLLRTQAGQAGRDALQISQLAAEIQQNGIRVQSLQANIEWYLKLSEKLIIRAPIEGQVISRDPQQNLQNRPVESGERLLTIANTAEQWHVVFEIPDREFGYLLQARPENKDMRWNVRFRLQSELEKSMSAIIDRADEHNTLRADGRSFVRVYATIDPTSIDQIRVGQSVTGRVDCGTQPLFFIWTRDVRDFLRTHFFLM